MEYGDNIILSYRVVMWIKWITCVKHFGQLSDHNKHYIFVPIIIIITMFQAYSRDMAMNRNSQTISALIGLMFWWWYLCYIILSLMEKTEHFHYCSGPGGGNMATRAPFHSKSKIPRVGSDWPSLDQSSVASRGRGQGHIVENCYFHGNPVDVCGSN